ncbi:Rossmann fold domain-containing protein [Sphingomonas sp. 28-62-11]|uniref:Rossmann fold domain-containing protein n=1 Tax=Sphingomonas sp. 28-62-11 TaxID=1970432 RepID=UPI000BC716AF|nr:MAG: hypothetical protein B7Y49_09940 [Sphingomonas sp. 28-62-11]
MKPAVVEGQGPLAAAVMHGLANIHPSIEPSANGDHAALVLIADPEIALLLQRVRRADAAAIVIVVDCPLAPTDRHLLLAAIEPLAVEGAPKQRVSAVKVQPGAHQDDVVAAVAYLLQAVSVTGQIIQIDSRGPLAA